MQHPIGGASWLRRSRTVGGIFLAVLVLAGSAPGVLADGGKYSVQEGDTLSDIAESAEVDVDTLRQLNGLTDADFIVVGQELTLAVAAPTLTPTVPPAPPSPPPVSAPSRAPAANATPTLPPAATRTPTPRPTGLGSGSGGTSIYIVQPGETLSDIAATLNTTWQQLAAANNLADPGSISIGQRLVVPGGSRPGTIPNDIVLSWPAIAPITTYFGEKASYYYSGAHSGLDFGVDTGTPVRAAASGTVVAANRQADEYGWHVIIAHNSTYSTLYAHLSRFDVKPGDKVVAGQQIGLSGNTGFTLGPHLHFELRRNGVWINPLAYLP